MLLCYHKVCIYVGSCVCVWILSIFWDLVPLFPSPTISYLKTSFIFNALVLLSMDSTTSNFSWIKAFAMEGALAGQYLKVLGPGSSQKSLTNNFLSAPAITYKLESKHIIFTFVFLHSSFHLNYFSCAWRTSIRGGLLVANSIFNI